SLAWLALRLHAIRGSAPCRSARGRPPQCELCGDDHTQSLADDFRKRVHAVCAPELASATCLRNQSAWIHSQVASLFCICRSASILSRASATGENEAQAYPGSGRAVLCVG